MPCIEVKRTAARTAVRVVIIVLVLWMGGDPTEHMIGWWGD